MATETSVATEATTTETTEAKTSPRKRTKKAKPGSAGNGGALLDAEFLEKQKERRELGPIKHREIAQQNHKYWVGEWMAARLVEPAITQREMALRLGIHEVTLNTAVRQGIREGWLKFDEALERMKHEVVPKTLDNLIEFLDKKDKTVTVETAKGTIFKMYQASEGINEGQLILALKIETMPAVAQEKAIDAQIVGRPRELKE